MTEKNEQRTLVSFGAGVRLKRDGIWTRTRNTPAVFRIVYNREANMIYSQVELKVGNDSTPLQFQITLPRSELLRCLNITKLLRRIYPQRPDNKKTRVFADNIAWAKELITEHNRKTFDSRLKNELDEDVF